MKQEKEEEVKNEETVERGKDRKGGNERKKRCKVLENETEETWEE